MNKEDIQTILDDELITVLKDGQACNHRGCLNHTLHACEGCGRFAGKGEVKLPKSVLDNWGKYRNET